MPLVIRLALLGSACFVVRHVFCGLSGLHFDPNAKHVKQDKPLREAGRLRNKATHKDLGGCFVLLGAAFVLRQSVHKCKPLKRNCMRFLGFFAWI